MTIEGTVYVVSGVLMLLCLGILGLQVHWIVGKVERIERVVKTLDPGADL